jgi:hypothetical protein
MFVVGKERSSKERRTGGPQMQRAKGGATKEHRTKAVYNTHKQREDIE